MNPFTWLKIMWNGSGKIPSAQIIRYDIVRARNMAHIQFNTRCRSQAREDLDKET